MTCAPYIISFDGSGTNINCGSNGGIDDIPLAAGFTVEAWVQAHGWGQNNEGRIMDKRGANTGWYLGIEPTGGGGATGGLVGYVDCVTANAEAHSGATEFWVDYLWHHVAMTYDNVAKIILLWLDGSEPAAYPTHVTGIGNYSGDSPWDLLIGAWAPASGNWDGEIGWSRVSDIKRYTATFTPPPRCTLPAIDGNTVGQWIGVENSGTTIDNQEGNALWDGTLLDGVFHCCDYAAAPFTAGVSVGQEATCEKDVYVANKHTRAQVDQIWTYAQDAGANRWTGNLAGTFPFNLIDVAGVVTVGDYIYFGCQTLDGAFVVANSGPFNGLVFDFTTVIENVTLGNWSYSTGGPGWAALNVQDNTWDGGAMTAGASTFDTLGVNSVHWQSPEDGAYVPLWAPQAVAGIAATAAYWVRAEVTAFVAAPAVWVAPVQNNRDVYAITEPYIEIAAAQVGGDLTALMKFEQEQVSSPEYTVHRANTYVMGVRDCTRGENFSAYLNFANEQNPYGVTVECPGGAATGVFVVYAHAPNGWALHTTKAAGIGPTLAGWIVIEEETAAEYAGTYHCFLRGKFDYNDSLPPMKFVLEFCTYDAGVWPGSRRVFHRTEYNWFRTTGAGGISFQLADMGQVTIPREVVEWDALEIDIYQDATDLDGGDCWIYDIILIPTDQWAGEGDNSQFREMGTGEQNVMDSISDLRDAQNYITKVSLIPGREKALARNRLTTASPPVLLQNKKQRLWVLCYAHDHAIPGDFYADVNTGHRTDLFTNQRYLSMRGAR